MDTSEYLKMYAQESAKEVVKASISGKVFKMPNFTTIQADPTRYMPELQRWKTAITKALKGEHYEMSIKHIFAWGPEDDMPEQKYENLPINGVPSNKLELIALMKMGRLGVKYIRTKLKESTADNIFDEAITYLSGGTITTYARYVEPDQIAKTKEAVELIKLTLSAGLNNEMEYPFIKGSYHDYKAVIQWIERKTEMLEKNEFMYELFQKIDESITGEEQIDTKCMQFRMALKSLYIDEPIKFPDWEGGDSLAESLEGDIFAPPQSFWFLWTAYKQIGHDLWVEIENEFKNEISAANYNKMGWMKNKPKLYEIINKKYKPKKKAKMAQMSTPEIVDHQISDDETLIEMEDGSILQVRPKFKGADKTWKRNFTKKFNLQQTGNNRWSQRSGNKQFNNGAASQNNRFNTNGGGNNNANSRNANTSRQNSDKPSADQLWKCKICANEGRTKKYRGDQQCSIHKYRPKWFNSIPLAGMRQIEGATEHDEIEDHQEKAVMNCIRTIMIGEDSD